MFSTQYLHRRTIQDTSMPNIKAFESEIIVLCIILVQ